MTQTPRLGGASSVQPTPEGERPADLPALITAWLHELVGRPLWSATVWGGSMVDIDLGALCRSDLPLLVGWHQVRLAMASWRIVKGDDTIVTCDDDPRRMQAGFDRLLGSRVVGVHQHAPDAFCLLFPDEWVLRVRPAGCAGEDDWELLRGHDAISARDGALTLHHEDGPTPDAGEAPGVTIPAMQHPAAPGILVHAGRASGILLTPGEVAGATPGTGAGQVHLVLEGRPVCSWAAEDSGDALDALGRLDGRDAPASVFAGPRADGRGRMALLSRHADLAQRSLLTEPEPRDGVRLHLCTHADRVIMLAQTRDGQVFGVENQRETHLDTVRRARVVWRRLRTPQGSEPRTGDPTSAAQGADAPTVPA